MSSKPPVPAPQAAEVQVVLNKPHTHRGAPLAAGATINVTTTEQAWLIQHGIIGGQQEELTHG